MTIHIIRCPQCHFFFLSYATRTARCRRCGSCFGIRSKAETRIVESLENHWVATMLIGLLNMASAEGPLTIDQARHLIKTQMQRGWLRRSYT